MEEYEAVKIIHDFSNFADAKQNEFQITAEKLIESDIKEKSKQLLGEYIKKLDAISEEFSGKGLKIDLESYVKGELARLDPDSAIDGAIDSRIETHTEKRSKQVTKRRRGLDRLTHPSSWFNPSYTITEHYDVEVKEEIRFVSREKLINQMLPPVRKNLYGERERILIYAESETQRVKEYFEAQFDKVDNVLSEKAEELRKATSSEHEAKEAFNVAEELMGRLDEIQSELDRILEI